jgi:tetratricopeptide (TPR) repeat protein
MRRKQWPQALEQLHKAEHLMPQVSGIRLNLGLVYYRQNQFRAAVGPFESVLRDTPDSYQARYLLGLCYFFTERYADAATMLEPLWPQASSQLNYLYVLGIAAGKSSRPDLEQRALGQLVETGQGSPELHLLSGKAHINREEYDEAIKELELAAQGNPKLPFVHFNLGVAYFKKQDLQHAKDEFLKDAALEPDVAYNYDQLGLVNSLQGNNQEAEKNLRQALRLDPGLGSSRYQLARVYQSEGKYTQALTEIDAAAKIDPGNSSVHYLRGQLLQRLGRTQDARAEMDATTRVMNQQRDKRQKELYGGPAPNPELTQEPQ